MKRWLRKTWETTDRKTREGRRREREDEGGRKGEREGDWLKRRESSAFSFHHWFRLPPGRLFHLSVNTYVSQSSRIMSSSFRERWRTEKRGDGGWEGKECRGLARDRRCRWDEKSFRSNQKAAFIIGAFSLPPPSLRFRLAPSNVSISMRTFWLVNAWWREHPAC